MTANGPVTPDWVAIDCDARALRGWAMRGGQVLAKAQSDAGADRLTQETFAPALEALIRDWSLPANCPIIACGVIGPDKGWADAPYSPLPCAPLGEGLMQMPFGPHNLWVITGLSQSSPPDVMHGEETRIAGFLSLNPGWDGVICLPGPHTKWVQVSADEVISFQTFLTGELWALLTGHSVLRRATHGQDWDNTAFDAAVVDAMGKPERLASRLFSIRADDLLHNVPNGISRARLSGQLIGAELAAARPYWLGMDVAIIGADADRQPYATALQSLGVAATQADQDRMTLAGLTAAYRRMQGAV